MDSPSRERADTDRRLLAELRLDGRASVTTLAHRLGIARSTVKARLDRLIADGTIQRFTIETRSETEGSGVRAIMTIGVQGNQTRAVVRGLRRLPEVSALYSTNGAWDLVAEIHTESLRDFDRVLNEIRTIPGVATSETSLLLDNARA